MEVLESLVSSLLSSLGYEGVHFLRFSAVFDTLICKANDMASDVCTNHGHDGKPACRRLLRRVCSLREAS